MNPNDTQVVTCLKSGKWVAKIQHPISKIWVFLGAYTTPEEATDACARMKLEYESHSFSPTITPTDFENHPGVQRTKSGKWNAKIKHNKESIWLGTYSTPREAAEAFNMSKLALDSRRIERSGKEAAGRVNQVSKKRNWKRCELDLKPAETQKSGFSQQRQRHAYKRSSGRWQSEVRDPITKASVYLGTFDTAEEAKEAYENKMREFDLKVSGHGKKISDADVAAQGKGNSNYVSDEPFVTTDGSSVLRAGGDEGKETGMVNVNAGETKGEFDLNVVDSYGRLIGEFSKLDDELWIC